MTIKAIETQYKGYRFRSRLEARWAVFFDAIGLKWEYEIEGFELPSGRYLPDFYLPQVNLWAEVKPVELNELEHRKAVELVLSTQKGCVLLVGIPECKPYWMIDYRSMPLEKMTLDEFESGDYAEPYMTDCVISMYHGYPINESRFYTSTADAFDEDDFSSSGLFADVGRAVIAARSARFEFNR